MVLWLAYFTINFSGPPALYINFAFQFAFCYAPPISGSATAEWSGRKTEREREGGEGEERCRAKGRQIDRVTTGLELVVNPGGFSSRVE